MRVFTHDGTALTLLEPPLGKGGEGAVYCIEGHSDKLAKIYLDASDAAARRPKIEAMASISGAIERESSLANVAWPLGALYADSAARQLVGFGMRKVDACGSLDELYEYPPTASSLLDMRDKLDLLVSLADITATLHRFGQVVGDFNTNNIPVLQSRRAVGLVDADSFHASIGGRTYPCTVCMSGYMAPELVRNVRGTTFEACTKPTFTQATDNFSLAVHVFRMLFNGCHPYYCQTMPAANGSVPAPLPVEKRVERGETPFFVDVPGAKVPPYAPDVAMLPSYLRTLFERAFVRGQTNPDARPSAQQWKDALIRFRSELATCQSGRGHGFWNGLSACPYCAADQRCGQNLRKSATVSGAGSSESGAGPLAVAATSSAVAVGQPRSPSTCFHTKQWQHHLVKLLLGVGVLVALCIAFPAIPAVGALLEWLVGGIMNLISTVVMTAFFIVLLFGLLSS